MHKIRTINIDGFLDQRAPITLTLSPCANFIIGRNGTGKTTLIKLINAALSADQKTLLGLKFRRIQFTFFQESSRKTPKIQIDKYDDETDGSPRIRYSFRASARADSESFFLTRSRRRNLVVHSTSTHKGASRTPRAEIISRLNTLFRKTWLSIQRGVEIFERTDFETNEIEYISGVDQKLDDVKNSLTRYFSRLDRQASELTQRFQQEWFLSFLATDHRASRVLSGNLDLESERAAIEQIFEKFEVPKESYASQLAKHVRVAERALSRLKLNRKQTSDEPFEFDDFVALYDATRLHTLVEQWRILRERQEMIYKPKNNLETICSNMLFRKSLTVDSSNSIEIKSDRESSISLDELSSGEKQLIIFLSETLLQNEDSYIFFADEPELSLHIEWQEQLVPSLLKINPNAQVIFATHSPDIVGAYQDSIINMERIIQ